MVVASLVEHRLVALVEHRLVVLAEHRLVALAERRLVALAERRLVALVECRLVALAELGLVALVEHRLVAEAHRLSCSRACGVFPDLGSNPRLLHRQADSLPLSHQGSPKALKQGRVHSPKARCDNTVRSPSILFNCPLIFE